MNVGCPAHRGEVGQLLRLRAVEIHRPDVGDETRLVEPAPDDTFSVRGEEWTPVISGNGRESPYARPIRVGGHDVNIAEVARVDLELLLLGGGKLPIVCVARGRERDPLTVGRVAGFSVIASPVGQ